MACLHGGPRRRLAGGTRVSRRHLDTGPTPRARLRLDARASVVVFREQCRSRRVLTPREAGPSSVKNAPFARSPRRSCSLHARLRQPHAAVAVFPGGSQLDWSEQVPCCPPLRHHHGQLPRLHRQGATWAMGRDSAAAGRRSPGCGSAAGWERQRQPLTIVAPCAAHGPGHQRQGRAAELLQGQGCAHDQRRVRVRLHGAHWSYGSATRKRARD